jgi:formate dehydrogenase (coenzyme F420) beta subunit
MGSLERIRQGQRMHTQLQVQNRNTLAALQDFFKKFLEDGLVDALLVPMRAPTGAVAHALVKDPALLASADPLAPVLPVNAATLVGKLSVKEPRPKVGVVLRSCELRALVELVKMQQASLESLTLIAVDCAGSYSVPVYMKKASNGTKDLWAELFKTATEEPSSNNPDLRPACQVCEQPVYNGAHVSIQLIGGKLDEAIHIEIEDDLAERLSLSPLVENGRAAGRESVLENFISARTAQRDAAFTEVRSRLEGEEGILGVFSSCIRCHNCMNVCPICYCKTCVFKSPIFDHEPMQFVNWARQKGALRMPSDTGLFHLTRLNHMGLSCVGCGMCSEACPAELPVGLVFRAIGERVQAAFEYQPGKSVDEPLPLITFKADEWTHLGE